MKRKLLTIFMCMAMVMCFMPGMAFAEEGATTEEPLANASFHDDELASQGAVAKIVGSTTTTYASIQAAVDAVTTETTIILLNNTTEAGISISGDKNITFDLNGKTWTGQAAWAGSAGTQNQVLQLLKGNKISIKNGTITSTGEGSKFIIQNYADLTLKDVTLDGRNLNNSGTKYVLSNNCGAVNIEGNTNITAPEGEVAFDVCWAPNMNYNEGTQVKVDTTGTITGKIELGSWGVVAGTESKSTLNISNGIFNGNIVEAYDSDITKKSVVNITGGTFSSDPTSYVGSRYKVYPVGDQFIVGETGQVAVVDAKLYDNLATAVAAAGNAKIVMVGDAVLEEGINIENAVTLDLNGKKITPKTECGTDYLLAVKRGGKLTVDDTSTGEMGEINSSSNSKVCSAIKMTILGEENTTGVSSLVINNGKIVGHYYGITGKGNRDNTTIEIKGGKIEGSNSKDSVGIYHPQQGTLTISGGEISGCVGVQMGAGTLNVTNGTITSTDSAERKDPYKLANEGDGTVMDGSALSIVSRASYGNINVTINGGTFSSTKGVSIKKYGYVKDTNWKVISEPTNSTLSIIGGTFSSNPSEYIASGYHVTGTNPFVVSAIPARPSTPTPPVTPTEPETKTETKTDATGTKVETTTTTQPDGSTSSVKTETKTDGSVAATTTEKDAKTGVEATTEVVKDAAGTTTAKSDVKAPATTTVANNTVTATVSVAAADKLVEQAASAEKKATESGATEVNSTITITASTSSEASKVEVKLPAETVDKIVSSTTADVVLETSVGEIKLDQEALKTVSGAAGTTGEVTIKADVVEKKDLPEALQEKVSDGAKVIDLSIETGNGNVKSFKGGMATISISIPANVEAPKAVYINTNGNVEAVPFEIVEKDGIRTMVFTTGHFSYYAIMSEVEADALVAETNAKLTAGVKNTKVFAKSVGYKKAVKVTWSKSKGYAVDRYKVYRATSKNGKYKLVKTTTLKSFKNIKLKSGKKYYYKVRGFRNIDGKTVYTKYSNLAIRTAK